MESSKDRKIIRRNALSALAATPLLAACGKGASPKDSSASASAPALNTAPGVDEGLPPAASATLRPLGKTGLMVEPVSLGGEGILRTTGRFGEAVPVVMEALRLGVRYCDTAPAYQQSQDYYGQAFQNLGKTARDRVIMASKTHERDYDGALRLLDNTLKRIGTDHLDIWQMHDLRGQEDLDEIFSKNGAISAAEKAKADGRVRFIGLTGHHDPAILVEAMRRYPFDTVLCAINPSDPRRLPFISTVVAEARKRNVGIVGMKVLSAGRLVREKAASSEELIRYAASFADTLIIGCSSIQEVRENLQIGRTLAPMPEDARIALEARIAPKAERYDYYKVG